MATLKCSQSVAERAIPVKDIATGKDTQIYRKEKADWLLSEGVMRDECALSSGAHHSLTVENRKVCYCQFLVDDSKKEIAQLTLDQCPNKLSFQTL